MPACWLSVKMSTTLGFEDFVIVFSIRLFQQKQGGGRDESHDHQYNQNNEYERHHGAADIEVLFFEGFMLQKKGTVRAH